MRVNELREKLKVFYPDTSVLLLGAPGIGKSETVRRIAEEIAKEQGKEFVEYDDEKAEEILAEPSKYFVFNDLRLTEVEPSDLIGIPRDENSNVRYKPLKWAVVLSKTAGILFLDEITNVQRQDIISAAYKLLLDRKAGYTKFNSKVWVVAAGNAPEHSSVANELPAPIINRMAVIKVDAGDINDWANYMDINYRKWDRRVYAFLQAFKQYYIQKPDDVATLEQFATPRQWTRLALILEKVENNEEMICSLVGKEAGMQLSAFLRVQVPDVKELLQRPEIFETLNTSQRYLTLAMVSQRSIEEQLKFAKWLFNKDREYFMVLYVMQGDFEKRYEFYTKMPEEVQSYMIDLLKELKG